MRLLAVLSSLVFLLVGLSQLAIIYGMPLAGVDRLLSRGALAYPIVTLDCWLLVAAGLVLEIRRRGRPAGNSGLLARSIDRFIGLEPPRLVVRRPIDPTALGEALCRRVVGQEAACLEIAAGLGMRSRREGERRPLGVLLLAGVPGSGKTLLGRCLAEATGRMLLHFDMTHYTELHAASRMFGVPSGYVGSDRMGRLTGGLRDHPDAVVLLDEIEKAHPEMLRKFLVAWNDGWIVDAGSGQEIPCSGAIFVLTTNAGAARLADLSAGQTREPSAMRGDAMTVLRDAAFAPEILDRIDSVVVFAPLGRPALTRLAALETEALFRSYGLEPAAPIEPAVFEFVLAQEMRGTSSFSARDIARLVERMLGAQLVTVRAGGASRAILTARPGGLAVTAA